MTEGNFADYVKVHIASGNGGKGSTHLHREKFVAKGGPDGGDGGRGGHVIIRANPNLWTLVGFKHKQHFKAGHGEHGSKNRSTGADGEDVYIDVPLGTVIKDAETDKVLAEITEETQEYLAAEGGMGGRGNWHFKTSTNQTPRYAQPGISGVEIKLILELKVLADVGLVGFPNAGKSTLLSVVTSAKPKIADYEFTTLKPNLGIVEYRDFKSFVMADIPGIIEGAAEGRGLGHYFLRHIERNSTLLFIISSDSISVADQYQTLLSELKRYNPELLDKNKIIAISKADLLDEELRIELLAELKETLPKDIPFILISAVAQQGIQELKDLLWNQLQD